VFTCYLAISEIEFTATGFDPRDDIFSVAVRAVYTCHIQLAVSHLSSFPLEVTASSSLLRGRNGQCHSKFYAVAATVWTSEFAFLVVLLRKSLQEAFVAIVTDELVMRHTTPSCGKPKVMLCFGCPNAHSHRLVFSKHRKRADGQQKALKEAALVCGAS